MDKNNPKKKLDILAWRFVIVNKQDFARLTYIGKNWT